MMFANCDISNVLSELRYRPIAGAFSARALGRKIFPRRDYNNSRQFRTVMFAKRFAAV